MAVPVTVKLLNTRVVCNNTLTVGLQEAGAYFKVKHTANGINGIRNTSKVIADIASHQKKLGLVICRDQYYRVQCDPQKGDIMNYSPETVYSDLVMLVDATMCGNLGLITTGTAGSGKTKTITDRIDQYGVPVVYNRGFTTMAAMWETLFDAWTKSAVVVFDDCDSIFSKYYLIYLCCITIFTNCIYSIS